MYKYIVRGFLRVVCVRVRACVKRAGAITELT